MAKAVMEEAQQHQKQPLTSSQEADWTNGRVMASTARHFPSTGNGSVAAANNSTNGSCTKKISKYSSSTHKFPQLPSSNRLNGHPHNSSDCSLKKPMSCRQKGLLVTTCSGAFFILSAVICAFVMKPVVKSQILQNLPLIEGSKVHQGWKDPPVKPVLYFYVFNLTNKEEFMSGSEKPNLVEMGPYSYVQDMKKVNVTYSPDGGSVSYMQSRAYHFSPDLSSPTVSETDVIVVPNVPYFGALKAPDLAWDFAKRGFVELLSSYKDEAFIDTKPFVRTTVGEFLWGYPSVLLSMKRQQEANCQDGAEDDPFFEDDDDFFAFEDAAAEETSESAAEEPKINCDIVPGNLAQFGLFLGRNNSILDLRTIKTGTQNLRDKGIMTHWHGQERVEYWREPSKDEVGNSKAALSCNLVEGRDPGTWPTDLDVTSVLEAFVGPLCRKLEMRFVKKVSVGEFDTLQFSPDRRSFDNKSREPSNACYCLEPQSCPPSGLLDISGCQPEGNPILMSWPHFLHGDPTLLQGVHGLNPDESRHSFIFNIEPRYGLSLTALAKLQMNLLIEREDGTDVFRNISQEKIYYPFAWLSEGIPKPSEEMASQVRLLLGLPDLMQLVMPLCMFCIGSILLTPGIVEWAKRVCNQRRNVADSTRVTATASYTKPTSVSLSAHFESDQ